MRRGARLLVWAAATDRTFEPVVVGDAPALAGRCIHCGRKLVVGFDGRPVGRRATLEHLMPRAAGGTEALENLAVACATCNHRKGVRVDGRARTDPACAARIEAVLARRRARWRTPPADWPLPALPEDVEAPGGGA